MCLSIGLFLLFLKNFQGFSESWRLPWPYAEVMTCSETSAAFCALKKIRKALLGTRFQIILSFTLESGVLQTKYTSKLTNKGVFLCAFAASRSSLD